MLLYVDFYYRTVIYMGVPFYMTDVPNKDSTRAYRSTLRAYAWKFTYGG